MEALVARSRPRFTRWVQRGALTASLTIAAMLITTPAWAHDGDGGVAADRKHAQMDLAGMPISEIEKATQKNAGVSRRAAAMRAAANKRAVAMYGTQSARAMALAADPGVAGTWSPVLPTEVVPVLQAVLPSGRILMWDSVGDNAAESYTNHTFTRAMVWNPADNTFRRVDVQGYNIFCAGFVQLPGGNVLVVGGNKNANLDGIRQTHLFNWRTETWSRGPDMSSERWYPSVAALANGEALIVGGGSSQAEVYQANNTFRPLPGFTSFSNRLYPFLVPRNDGKVELVGPNTQLQTMDTSGAGALTASTTRDGIIRDYGSFATFLPGRTLVTGGGSVTEDGLTQVPTRTAVIVDTTSGGTTVSAASPMNQRRRQHNLTILADGSVLATGGEQSASDGLVDLVTPALAAERWDPATGAWTTLAQAARVREYHSAASLLPDGRVLTGGGGICGNCVTKGYLEKNIEYFTPPYLYKHDGSGALAVRPTLNGVPGSATIGARFTMSSLDAGSIRKVGLVRLGAATHSVDQGQRYVPLTFSAAGTELTVSAPAENALAPPGYYMLFATNAQGVPSVASMIQIIGKPTPVNPAPVNLALGKPASASSVEVAQFGVALGNDGNATTRWSSARSDNQWWQVDLGSAQTIDTVVTSWEAAYAKRFQVQTSLDGTTFTTAATVDATAAGTQRTTFTARSARYVRIQGITRATGYGYSLYETQVFGTATTPPNSAPTADAGVDQAVAAQATVTLNGSASSDPEGSALSYRWTQTEGPAVTLSSSTGARPTFPAPATTGTLSFSLTVNDGTLDSVPDAVQVSVSPAPVNLALGKPASASSVEVAQFGVALGNDGNATTRWSSARSDNQWWQVDLGSAQTIDTVVTSWEAAYAKRFQVQTSLDGTTFTTAATVDATAAGTQRTTFTARSARYVRIQGITRATGYGYSLYETQVFGTVR